MRARKIMTLILVGVCLVLVTLVSGHAEQNGRRLLVVITSDTPGATIKFEGSLANESEAAPYRHIRAKTPFEITLPDTHFLGGMFSGASSKSKLSVRILREEEGEEKTIAWTTGRTVVFTLEDTRTAIRGF